jgi:hypothetical protein
MKTFVRGLKIFWIVLFIYLGYDACHTSGESSFFYVAIFIYLTPSSSGFCTEPSSFRYATRLSSDFSDCLFGFGGIFPVIHFGALDNQGSTLGNQGNNKKQNILTLFS